jgi:hypothetical protein
MIFFKENSYVNYYIDSVDINNVVKETNGSLKRCVSSYNTDTLQNFNKKS